MTEPPAITLPKLIERLPVAALALTALPDVPVSGVTEDSRTAGPGSVFVAVKGGNVDGHRFIAQVAEKGAVAVVGTEAIDDPPLPYIRVPDSREALAYLAAAFYGNPAHRLTVIGVTGTDGKTTTTSLIYRVMLAAGIKAGMISTVNAVIGDEVIDTGFHVTTPTAPEIQGYLARMVAAGLTHVVLETTSYGLAQHRVTGCEFDIGVLTNITHEHLDNHGSFEAYRAAKALLFTGLSSRPDKPNGVEPLAVLNGEDASLAYLEERVTARKIVYSTRAGADIWAEAVRQDSAGLHFVVNGPDYRFVVDSRLMGLFNVSNILAAVGATVTGLGIAPQPAQAGIASLAGVPGRMEWIDLGQPFTAIVDFAHTPNALYQALATVREMTRGRVIAVFGSAGLRDREKRRMMAEVSAQMADVSIFTAEDPRTESLEDILAAMAAGAVSKGGVEGKTFMRVPDRGDAIRAAVNMAQPGDLVIACGKGHEQSMAFGAIEYPWDDRTAMRAALAERLGVEGPEMPYLPTREKNRDSR